MNYPAEYFSFISENAEANPLELRLKMHGKSQEFDIDDAILQIECRRKCRKKLRRFISNDRFLFPSSIAAEQASHQAVGLYHASLIEHGDIILDMTAGLGIDSLSMSYKAKMLTACELDLHKADILSHNCKELGCDNIRVITGDSVDYVKTNDKTYDVVFIDPARRGSDSSRLYNLHDCQPDVTNILPHIMKISKRLLIKASPLLDVSQTLRDIPDASSIKAISVEGECKELLIEIDSNKSSDNSSVYYEAVNLDSEGGIIASFAFSRPKKLESNSGGTQNSPSTESHDKVSAYALSEDIHAGYYLYEPDASVMKLMPWTELTMKFPGLKKVGISTHLFISENYHSDFPGRKLKITDLPGKAGIKGMKGMKANVCVRNYPLQAEQLRKKIGLKEGDDTFVYGFRLGKTPMLAVATIIK